MVNCHKTTPSVQQSRKFRGGDPEGVDYFGSVKTSQKGCFLATLKNDERVDNRVSYGSEYFPEILWLYTTHGHWV